MSGPIALAQGSIAAFALHALWQVPLIGAAAWLAIRIGRPNVRISHAIWSITLALCVLMPCVSTIAGRRAALAAERAARAASIDYSMAEYAGPLPELQREPLWLRTLHRHISGRGVQPFSFALPGRVESGIAAVYAVIAVCFLFRLVLAWRRSVGLVRDASTDALPPAVADALGRQCIALQIQEPAVCLSDEIVGPALAGVRRPVLLLPSAMAAKMSAAEIDAVLAHELSHLRRHDPLMHALSSLLVIPVGFHPVAVWVARRVRQTREMACDADAAVQMGSSAKYARALLQVAERTGGGPVQSTGLGLFTTGLGFLGTSLELFGAGGAMEERMETLMHGKQTAGGKLRMGVGLGLAAVAVLAATMVQVQPALAAEQAAAETLAAKTDCPNSAQAQPKLIGGDHAREQLRKATRRLDEAEQRATTAAERQKIATARDLALAAEQQLAAASGHNQTTVRIHGVSPMEMHLQTLDGTRNLNIHVDPNIDMHALQQQSAVLSEELKAQLDSPAWKARVEKMRADAEKHRVEAEKIRAQFETPEFKAAMRAQIAQAQKVNVITLHSAELQRQMADAAQTIARMEMPAMPVPPVAPVAIAPLSGDQQNKPVKVASAVLQGNLLSHENPVYPPEAKEKRIQGPVVLHAIIGETGTVESLQVVSSPDPLLSKSAAEAVQKWTYKPYLLNGNPTAVDTTITVNFSLAN